MIRCETFGFHIHFFECTLYEIGNSSRFGLSFGVEKGFFPFFIQKSLIERAINSSPGLRNKKDLIEQFVDSVNTKAKVDAQWQAFVAAKKAEELERSKAKLRRDGGAR